ncbi:hypothetical protein POTOM_043656 [Populus tomentosa]|uniref:Transmembrane protein n=1 Tax=Populus tomentosa TaxID=118781 RepID=A0A8X7YKV9_POPTO|nr:hypothetical protein POTOM_043656 [Populus tomentosa]
MPSVERSARMERTQKMLLILAVFMLVLASNVEAGRKLKDTEEKVDHPQNYLGGFGTSGGFIPTPNGPVFAFGPSVFCSYPGGLEPALAVEVSISLFQLMSCSSVWSCVIVLKIMALRALVSTFHGLCFWSIIS